MTQTQDEQNVQTPVTPAQDTSAQTPVAETTAQETVVAKVLDFEKLGDGLVKIQLQILTGRTHQIRYHLSNHGLPIQGDYLYGREDENIPMQLTAWKLEYLDLNGKMQVVEI